MLSAVSEVDECAHLAHLFRSCTYAQNPGLVAIVSHCKEESSRTFKITLDRLPSRFTRYPALFKVRSSSLVSGTITTTPLAGYYGTALIRKRGAGHGSAIYLPTPESTRTAGTVCESCKRPSCRTRTPTYALPPDLFYTYFPHQRTRSQFRSHRSITPRPTQDEV